MPKITPQKVSIIIPAYNEEGNIPLLIEKIEEMRQESGLDLEAILINDGSTDATGRQIQEAKAKYPFIRAVEHYYNMGLGLSLTDGFAESSGDILVFFPADLQYLPEDIPQLLAPFADGYDIVTGWRQGYYPKEFISRIYNWLSRQLFSLKVHNLNSVKAMRRRVVEDLILSYGWHRYLVALAASRGFRVTEVKINLYPRQYGKSKFGVNSILIAIVDLFIVKIYITFSHKPTLLFGLVSALQFLAASLISAAVFASFILKKDFLLGVSLKSWLLFVVILAIGAILFLLVGYVAEMITHLEIRLKRIQNELAKSRK
jgi:glycosyltransferase involved in cell wall biosynthesis